MQALIVSAYPGCGKTHYVSHNPPFYCEDSDSSFYSWIYDGMIKTDRRNPAFPENYIDHIKSLMYKRDVIFVSSHKVVRDALYEKEIPHVILYPCREAKDEWMRRFKKRGSTDEFIKFQNEHWDEFIDEIESTKSDNIRHIIRLYEKPILSGLLDYKIRPYISTSVINYASTHLFDIGIDTYPYFKTYYPELYKSVRINL